MDRLACRRAEEEAAAKREREEAEAARAAEDVSSIYNKYSKEQFLNHSTTFL